MGKLLHRALSASFIFGEFMSDFFKNFFKSSHGSTFRTDIAGIRGIAVMLVALAHFEIPGFGGGFIGPDIFFVLSGYLITGLLAKEYNENISKRTGRGKISLGAFYLRRTRRILPASLFVLLCINIYARLNMNVLQVAQIKTDSIWTVLFGANVNFLRQATDYFAQNNAVSPLQHYWSLAVEEQFYFVWPVLFLAAASFHKISFRGRAFDVEQRLRAVFIAMGIGSFAWMLVEFTTSPITAYFSTFSRAWELALGGALSLLSVSGVAEKLGRAWTALRVVALAAMVGSIAVVTPTNFGYTLVIPAVATGFLLISGVQSKDDLVYRFLSLKPLTALGAISFSMYLWHWPVFVFGRNLDLMNTLAQRFTGVVVCIVLGTLSYWLVERTFLKIPLPKPTHRPNFNGRVGLVNSRILTSSATLLVVAGLGFVTYPSASASEGTKVTAWVPPASAASYAPGAPLPQNSTSQEPGAVVPADWEKSLADATALTQVPDNLDHPISDLADSKKWEGHGFDCMNIRKSTVDCDRGSILSNRDNSAPKLVILGDSYASSMVPGLMAAFDPQVWNVRGYLRGECMFADVNVYRSGRVPFPDCPAHRQWAIDQAIKLRPSVVVIIQNANTEHDGGRASFALGMKKSLDKVSKSGAKVVVVGNIPTTGNLSTCVLGESKLQLSCFRSPIEGQAYRSVEESTTVASGGIFINPVPWLCYENSCPPVIDDAIVKWDGSHLTTWFSKRLGPFIAADLRRAGVQLIKSGAS